MGYEVVPGRFCASYWGVFEVEGSKGTMYTVMTYGSEAPATCTCPAWHFSKKPMFERECKHIERVWREACMWNCQWHDGNRPVLLKPLYTDNRNIVPDEKCPNCDGPLVAVLIAV